MGKAPKSALRDRGDAAPARSSGGQHGPRTYRVAFVSDFFYPAFGGVEIHIYNVAQCLMRRGHKVIVITRSYEGRTGVRYLTSGLKVYYTPFVGVKLPPGTVTLPTTLAFLPLLRSILLRERIDIVHGHQTTSNLCHEAVFHANNMGLKVCFTDHSLFGFADGASIHINKVLQYSLRCADQIICVSHTSRENTVLRAKVPPERVSVVPNATDTSAFTPPTSTRGRSWGDVIASDCNNVVTIVVVTRLVFRKGSDLLADAVPAICCRHPNVRWVIAGDGPRTPQLEQMIERYRLSNRVELVGALKHSEVASTLRRGQIFVNFSLTEAFCIAIIEAVSCGLLAVSTRVGGVPEILPSDMLLLAGPEPQSIIGAVERALQQVQNVSPWEFHRRVASFYRWDDVAERVEAVYDLVQTYEKVPLQTKILRYRTVGPVYGLITICILMLDYFLLWFLEWWHPREHMDIAAEYPIDAAAGATSRVEEDERE